MTNPAALKDIEVTIPIWEYKQVKNFQSKMEALRKENDKLRKEINTLKGIVSNVIRK